MTEHEKKPGSADVPETQDAVTNTDPQAEKKDTAAGKKAAAKNVTDKAASEKKQAETPAADSKPADTTAKPAPEAPQPRKTPPAAEEKQPAGFLLGAIALAVILLVGGGVWYASQAGTQALSKDLAAENAQLKSQVAQLQQTQQQTQKQMQEFKEFIARQSALSTQQQQQEAALKHELELLRSRITVLSSTDVKSWLLAQADFLVKMAERKLWNDQDVVTAMVLLKNADASLAEMNDPSLLDVRTALRNDITALSAVSQIDFDGTILRLNQLAGQVDNLRLDDGSRDGAPMDSSDSEGLTSSVADWRTNLTKSWKGFMSDFITIRRRDNTSAPLLAPNQDIYVRENIRAQLLIAAQAVPRHQEESYKQSLDAVSTWVRAYFSDNDPANTAFLAEVDALAAQPISMSAPDSLTSQPLLDKLVQTRIRRLLNDETPPPAPAAPQQAAPAAAPVQPAAAPRQEG
ncbi:uroporphyrinogen-III C-methyltransferase [Morganella morganii]|uniref:uroporphyrinogen-III C-methyltransferase n=1 Tax=Morganella morganii TaxID=582 RepID=UPI001A2FA5A0|nr:uroporphyrinogen-III C-methyltransferase [Morganella morganii]MCU6212998.1 uroporphyrinogen-III C-methyltransferase [Morganella morganii]MCU6226646.1 uroporphyrinogen-III C-methyltransferase [Morganella morganii]MCU6235011.1 uroporphyrinogen-III C-methyltransferase [Morganella morganii]HAT1514169.1 uroporphyrinogen-III C-methyltransferase [Morganella morganii]HAT1526337.1 uroporphyrinogen-III C-methyltransferase [Morganella morganii]